MSDYDRMIDLAGQFGNLDVDDLGVWLQSAVESQIREQFDGKFDPHGQPWPPNKTTPWYFDPNNHIRDTYSVGYGNHEIIVSSSHIAAVYQAEGTYGGARIQAKPVVPDERGLGLWGPLLLQTFHRYMDATLGADTGRSPNRVGKPRRGSRRGA